MVSVAAFYHFAPVAEPERLRAQLERWATDRGLLGTLLVAEEGINGTLCGDLHHLDDFLELVRTDDRFAHLRASITSADRAPFHRLRVRVRPEIVTLRAGEIDVAAHTGVKVAPREWDGLIARDDVTLVDARNRFEVAAGTFPGALDPETESFHEFTAWIDSQDLDPQQPIAMFCTGGIRCEKASAYLTERGFSEVYQLDGGILAYLEDVPPDEQSWRGECVVFDERRTVDQRLERGDVVLCHNCSMPVHDTGHPDYEAGVQCPACATRIDDATRARFRERRRQIELADRRGEKHVGRHSI